MADVILKDKSGNDADYSGVTQINIGDTRFSNMEEVFFYYAKPSSSNSEQFTVVGSWFASRGKNYAACSLTNKQCEGDGLENGDAYSLICIFTTTPLEKGETYNYADL